ncbi:hypothetical protein LOZ65_000515 [Ophidiomyces ophidiicola]|nr:hypothetical protein LOZ65_000515 [Ophidiomyces ophidiicola]
MAAINSLPREIFLEILVQFKRASCIRSLLNCLLVCRSWRDAALPLLYGNVVLSGLNLLTFCEGFNPAYGSHVRSVTLKIGHDHGSSKGELDDGLRRFSGLLSKLERLSTLSFHVSSGFLYDISHGILLSLVQALPESCVNLEIDTHHYDVPSAAVADGHLCEQIRHILPRMRHVRLSLRYICSALIGTGPLLPCPANDAKIFSPIALPNIQNLVVSCASAARCRLPKRCQHLVQHEADQSTGWDSVTQALKLLVKNKRYSDSAKFFVFSSIPGDDDDRSQYDTLVCTEMVSQTTLAFPIRFVAMTDSNDGWLLRTQTGQDILSFSWALRDFAEGEAWRDTIGGGRFPAEVLRRGQFFSTICVEKKLPILSQEMFKDLYPRKSCDLWTNEQTAGKALLIPETRTGETYLSRTPLSEATPSGFVRAIAEENQRLYKEGDPNIPDW